jgi:hypothetical protein
VNSILLSTHSIAIQNAQGIIELRAAVSLLDEKLSRACDLLAHIHANMRSSVREELPNLGIPVNAVKDLLELEKKLENDTFSKELVRKCIIFEVNRIRKSFSRVCRETTYIYWYET